ncbi:hypothetical protein DFJ77DRAFT_498286 [Powellomyces hirtus]|nr:hypothetical protein DFJ77DRAFT_498286 [Powellomyces hirtus]
MTIPTPRYDDVPDRLCLEVVNAPAVPGEGKPRVNFLTVDREYRVKQFGKLSMWDLFQRGRTIAGDSPCLGKRVLVNGTARHYTWETYDEVHHRAERIGSALVKLGLKQQDKIAIFAKNCPEYTIVELAAFRQSGVVVPIYDTLVSDESVLAHMLNLTECGIIFTTSKQVSSLLSVCGQASHLKMIVVFDEILEKDKQQVEQMDVELLLLADLEKMGARNMTEPTTPKGADMAKICFSSGTTGLPKGIILTHGMITSSAERYHVGEEYGLDIPVGSTDVLISYLPMAHVFEMVLQTVVLHCGARIGFWQGDVARLMLDVQELKPTLFAGTPRIYNRIYDGVMAQVSKAGWVKSALFHTAYNGKLTWLARNMYNHAIWDNVVFAKVKQMLGGRVRILLTGAAPLGNEVASFLRIAFSCPLLEGYGMTEGMGSVTVTYPRDTQSVGTVGIPIPGVIVKLVDVPDMNYLSSSNPPAGEICFKGPVAFPGYYKDPERTAETIDADGWVHTGDIGIWTPSGHLKIIDRKKNLFKLSQGEYVSPEKVEQVYSRHELIDACFVTGNSTESSLVAVINPTKGSLMDFIKEKALGVSAETPFEQICENKLVRKAVITELTQWVRRQNVLKGFEIIKNVVLEPKLFADIGLITPTFKLKRHDAKVHYELQVQAMYKESL